MYLIRVGGEKVRFCNTMIEVLSAQRYVKGKVTLLSDVGRLPRAEKSSNAFIDERIKKSFCYRKDVIIRTI